MFLCADGAMLRLCCELFAAVMLKCAFCDVLEGIMLRCCVMMLFVVAKM